MGPFLDIHNQDIYSGEMSYDSPDGTKVYISHEDLFNDLVNMIQKQL